MKGQPRQGARRSASRSARPPRAVRRPTGPSLSDALGTTPTVPDAAATKSGAGTFDTLTGNPLAAMSDAAGRVADSTGNWVDGLAPAWTRPYLRLARLDRPIGSWLLLMPCWWSVGARRASRPASRVNLWHVVLFFIGAFAMRGAGCTWNDIVDRDLDARVERTRSRPIPSGQVSVAAAAVFLVAAGADRARGAAAVQPLRHLRPASPRSRSSRSIRS